MRKKKTGPWIIPVIIIWGGVMLWVAVWLPLTMIRDTRMQALLDEQGATATGQVIGLRRGVRRTRYIRYEFKLPLGEYTQTFRNERGVPDAIYQRYRLHDPISIVYLPDAPSQSNLSEHPYPPLTAGRVAGAILGALFFGCLGVGGIWAGISGILERLPGRRKAASQR